MDEELIRRDKFPKREGANRGKRSVEGLVTTPGGGATSCATSPRVRFCFAFWASAFWASAFLSLPRMTAASQADDATDPRQRKEAFKSIVHKINHAHVIDLALCSRLPSTAPLWSCLWPNTNTGHERARLTAKDSRQIEILIGCMRWRLVGTKFHTLIFYVWNCN